MEYIEDLVLIAHMLAAVGVIGLVLIQQGKGAEAGSGFGSGSAGTVFGSSGAGNFLTRTTTLIAVVFFVTSFALAFFAKEKSRTVQDIGVPAVMEVPFESEGSIEGGGSAIPGDSEIPSFEGQDTEQNNAEIPE